MESERETDREGESRSSRTAEQGGDGGGIKAVDNDAGRGSSCGMMRRRRAARLLDGRT